MDDSLRERCQRGGGGADERTSSKSTDIRWNSKSYFLCGQKKMIAVFCVGSGIVVVVVVVVVVVIVIVVAVVVAAAVVVVVLVTVAVVVIVFVVVTALIP